MKKLNELLRELGISKVKLAKFLGVSRQMIYNYLELDDINKWPKDKKVLLLNLLGVKSVEEMNKIKVTTDYIMDVETRLNLVETTKKTTVPDNQLFEGLDKKEKELLYSIVDLIKEKLEDKEDPSNFHAIKYIYNFLQSMDNSVELKYLLAYVSKMNGFVKPTEFVFDEEDQFIFESIMFSAKNVYSNKKTVSPTKIAELHKRFVDEINKKMEEVMGRTLELNTIKIQALKELNYTKLTEENASEVLEKMAEIESRSK